MQLVALVSDFRTFVKSHPELKQLAIAEAIGASPSTLSMILAGSRNPTAAQLVGILNFVRGGSTKIVGLQENGDPRYYVNGDPNQRIELNGRNVDYLTRFAQKVDCTMFDNSGRVAREGADPSDDPANSDSDITSINNRKTGAGAPGTDDPSLDNLLSQLDNLYRVVGEILATNGIKKATVNRSSAQRKAGSQPSRFDERRHAIKCEENRRAEVDAYYEREGIKRRPEAILARAVYRDELPAKYKPNRKLAYS